MRKVSEAEGIANTEGDWQKALAAHIKSRKSLTMDWLGLEATLRAYVKVTGNHDLDVIISEFTMRGYELACPVCGKEIHMDDSCKGQLGKLGIEV